MEKRWDLIIVGAGSAGAALAARLAERGRRVLLLEAGPDYRSAEMPEAWRSPNPLPAILAPEESGSLVWPDLLSSRTDAQEPRLYWRGRGAGGSSSINGQIAIRPPREDFDDWAALGCPGWGWDEVLPYFCRLENDEAFGSAPYHGDSGPIPIYRMPRERWGAVYNALAMAAMEAGFAWADDLNAPGATGVSPYPINSRDSRRVSTNDGYLEPSRSNPNLTIRGDALVNRILFDGDRAIGVEIVAGDSVVQEYADDVVLSAGVIHSPAILMRSGIGPADHLRELGIDIVVDLPVGEGMQDHPIAGVELPLRADTAIQTPDDRHTNCCVRYSSNDPDGTPNDMMLVSMNQAVLSMDAAETAAGAGLIGVWLNQAYSRGTVRLTSRDPRVHPEVRESMLSDERDRRRMREGIRMLAKMAALPEVTSICAFDPAKANGPLLAALDGNDDDLDAFLLANVSDTQHGTSTCRMGAAGDPGAVVDTECRVLGIDGLRVIDASIFPFVLRSNTNLATIMLGEYMADRLSQ